MDFLQIDISCKIDEKGRILLPIELRKLLGDSLHGVFILKPSINYDCLDLYTKSSWDKFLAKLGRIKQPSVKTHANFIRAMKYGIKELTVDGNDRLTIPKELIGKAELTKEIQLSGAIDKIEIWDKQKYEEQQELFLRSMEGNLDTLLGELDDLDTVTEEQI